jgi:hypothetical protein
MSMIVSIDELAERHAGTLVTTVGITEASGYSSSFLGKGKVDFGVEVYPLSLQGGSVFLHVSASLFRYNWCRRELWGEHGTVDSKIVQVTGLYQPHDFHGRNKGRILVTDVLTHDPPIEMRLLMRKRLLRAG